MSDVRGLKVLVTPGRYVSAWTRVPPDFPLALMDLLIGVLFVVAPGRTRSPSYAVAKSICPMDVWGLGFIIIGLSLLASMIWGWDWAEGIVRVFGPVLFVMWAVLYLLAALDDSKAGLVGVFTFPFLAFRHFFAPVRRFTIPQFDSIADAEEWLKGQFGDRR